MPFPLLRDEADIIYTNWIENGIGIGQGGTTRHPLHSHMHNVNANSNSGFSQGTEPSRKRSDSLRSTAVTEINKV